MNYKKAVQVFTLIGVLLLAAGSVWAVPITYTIPDNVVYWPGYPIAPSYDQLGISPTVEDMQVTVDNGVLQEVRIFVQNRRFFDALFINNNWNGTLGDYQSWDYYAQNDGSGATLSKVNNFSTSDYILVPEAVGGRIDHPSGIKGTALTSPGSVSLTNEIYDGTWLTYDFTGLSISGPFVIGYSQVCANDVHLAFVPEPITMLLLGLGLVGLAGIRRKIR